MPNGFNNLSFPDSGRLQVAAFSVDVGRPAVNATVQVTTAGDSSDVVEELVTDDSGQTSTITLPAPPVDFSMEFQDEVRPYSEYDLYISMPGYHKLSIRNVQVLPDATALQDVRLHPLLGQYNDPNELVIPDNTLWGSFPPKIAEPDVKALPPGMGFVVLPDPVIPEFIIVHDGYPTNTSAPNYWIPFKDYIKNVASCEIYSNWPTATIEANVLAILSFTLNRVFTEWYRSKGYDFTITSSTAFDQAFSYGRNIFSEISTVVDNIFNMFITRPGIRQPLFTQYCDGRKVSCPNWMTQWGSKALGDQGYDSVGILRNFYGQEIFLMEAEQVAGVPSSFPGYALQMGSTGDSVRTIQTQLNAISNNYPAINKMKVDGIFGNQTRTAVETFQSVFRLPASGIVDFATWFKISYIFVSVTRMAELK